MKLVRVVLRSELDRELRAKGARPAGTAERTPQGLIIKLIVPTEGD